MSPTIRRARAPLALLVLLMTLASGLAFTPPASAAVINYVDLLTYREKIDHCLPGQALPCTTNAGIGTSNVLRITQVTAGKKRAFGAYETTSFADDRVWLAATISADCKPTRRLKSASVELGYSNFDSSPNDPVQVNAKPFSTSISVPNARSMPTKTVALHPRVVDLFEYSGAPGSSDVAGFATLADVFAHGEAVIAARKAAGQSEAKARSASFTVETTVATTARVFCRNLSGSKSTYRERGRYLPLTIEFVGSPIPPVAPPTTDDLATPAQATDVHLDVVPDPFTPCTLRLYGDIEVSRATKVRYRFVKPNGQLTPIYEVQVNKSRVAHVAHSVPVPHKPASAPGDPGDDLAGDVDANDYAGTYILRVISPNRIQDADGFRVGYCPVDHDGPGGVAG